MTILPHLRQPRLVKWLLMLNSSTCSWTKAYQQALIGQSQREPPASDGRIKPTFTKWTSICWTTEPHTLHYTHLVFDQHITVIIGRKGIYCIAALVEFESYFCKVCECCYKAKIGLITHVITQCC